MASLERARIEEALRAEGWNISRAAARLGLPRNTLRYRMERHGLTRGRRGAGSRRRSDSRRPRTNAAPPPPVRWQRTRVTLLQAQVLDADATVAEHERARVLEDIARKASAFGGRIIELVPRRVKAAFGLDLVEDAARHAAHAAFAVQRAVGASHSAAGGARIALHTEEMLVGRLEDRVELDADGGGPPRTCSTRCWPAHRGSRSSRRRRPGRSWSGDSTSSRSLPHRKRRRSWRVIGLADADRHASPFVSRTREIALLEDLLPQVEEGRGQAVLVGGRPGHRQDAPAARVPSPDQRSCGLAAGIGRVLRQLAAVSSADRPAQDAHSPFSRATPTR